MLGHFSTILDHRGCGRAMTVDVFGAITFSSHRETNGELDT